MSLNNSSSQRGNYRRQNQTRNLTTTTNYNLSIKQLTPTNDLLPSMLPFNHYKLIFFIILPFVILLLIMIIFLCISKGMRKKSKKIQRKKPVSKRPFQPKPDTSDDTHITLLGQNDSRTIDINHATTNGNMNNLVLTDIVPVQEITNSLPNTPRGSTNSISSRDISTTHSENIKDDLPGVNLNDVPLRCMTPSKNNLIDLSLSQAPDPPPNEPYKNPYVVEYIAQEEIKAEERKKRTNSQASKDSKSSEESCV